MPYLMGGYPDVAGSLRLGEALVEAGADLIELGVPFSDPLADGPVIQAAGEQALRAGATFDKVIDEVAKPLAESVPARAHVLREPDHLARLRRSRRSSHAGRCCRADRARPSDRRSRRAARRHATAPAWRSSRSSLRRRRRSGSRRRPPRARGFIYVVSVTGVTGERNELPPGLADVVARVRERRERSGGGRIRRRHARAGREGR